MGASGGARLWIFKHKRPSCGFSLLFFCLPAFLFLRGGGERSLGALEGWGPQGRSAGRGPGEEVCSGGSLTPFSPLSRGVGPRRRSAPEGPSGALLATSPTHKNLVSTKIWKKSTRVERRRKLTKILRKSNVDGNQRKATKIGHRRKSARNR